MNKKYIFPALACGIISAGLAFWIIPAYFAKGVPDYIWMTLMVVLPILPAVLLLKKFPLRSILWSAAVQCIIVMVMANPIGKLLGYQLGDIANDLFDYIGYPLFCSGWIAAGTVAQYAALLICRKICK